MHALRLVLTALLTLVLAGPALAGAPVDPVESMKGAWVLVPDAEDRCEANRARLQLEANPTDGGALQTLRDFEEEHVGQVVVRKGVMSFVERDGEPVEVTWELVSVHEGGLIFDGRARDDDIQTVTVTFLPGGRMLWAADSHDETLSFVRAPDPARIMGTWAPLLPPVEQAELDAARQTLKDSPDDAVAQMTVEMIEELLASMYIVISEGQMRLTLGDEQEHITWTSAERGGRLEVTTTDSDGEVEAFFVTLENDGTMSWTKGGEEDVLDWRPR
jgi:hypothetical protein